MHFKHYLRQLLLRLAVVFALMLLLSYLLLTPGYHAASLLTALVLAVATIDLIGHIRKSNLEVARFFEAVKYKDFSQRFAFEKEGVGFSEMATAFEDIMGRLQGEREQRETQLRHLRAVVEHVPVPLMSVHHDGKITLWNNAARRLFVSKVVTKADDLSQYGDDFHKQLRDIKAGARRLTTFEDDKLRRKVTLQASAVMFAGRQEKLISVQDIQSELDGAQLQAWQDLVRVLTHEIMNSITPITSLAKTAADLVQEAQSRIKANRTNMAELQSSQLLEDLDDVADAVQTVARRSDGLMNFISSYRRLTRLPPASRQTIKLQTLFDRAIKLADAQWSKQKSGSTANLEAGTISVSTDIQPTGLSAKLDTDMVEQILLNLLQNAGHAIANKEQGLIQLAARLNQRGNIEIAIGDNGDGVPAEIGNQVFVPFFTTKRQGSGVGLALTRQVMQAHGGTVSLGVSHLGGAQFSLVF